MSYRRLAWKLPFVLTLLLMTLPAKGILGASSAQGPATNVVVFLQGVCSSMTDGTATDDAAFAPLRAELMSKYGYTSSQFLDYSYLGGFVQQLNGKWVWHHSGYGEMTPV